MQIYGYPGDRVDFVSTSASAGSIFFGDTRLLVEEFFGSAHTEKCSNGATELSWFNGSITVVLRGDKVSAVRIVPRVSREKIDVYLGKDKLTLLTANEAAALIGSAPVTVAYDKALALVEFTG